MTEKQSGPTVLIVGAGTGGLMLALLCEKGNIPYMVTIQPNFLNSVLVKS
jgi:cation diffusion facilitator CzcD-associated flavoprotein CzcO